MIIVFQMLNFHMFLQKKKYGPTMKDLANHKARDIHGLNHEFLEWVAKHLCEPTTKLFNVVARGGFPTSWTTNIIQMIFKFGEKITLRNFKIIMLDTIFGNHYSSVLRKK